MRYALIDQDGTLSVRTATHYRDALEDCGPEGWDLIRVAAAGFVAAANDCGLVLPDRYQRNVVATLLLIGTLGAARMPYAGPVVIAGWDEAATARGEAEIIGLTGWQVTALTDRHRMIRDAVAGNGPADEVEAAQRGAEWVRTAPVPGITILTDDEALEHLRRMHPGRP